MKFDINDYNKGDIIRFIRQYTGLTQKDFASAIGKSKRTIEEYEANQVNYGIEVLKDIANKFDIKITIEKNYSQKK